MKFVNYIKVLLPFLVLAGLFVFKKYYLEDVSDLLSDGHGNVGREKIYEKFVLDADKNNYHGTLLEFGAKNCSACRQMEDVLDELESLYQNKIIIRFMNTTVKEGLIMGRNFGIIAIPTQILLNSEGKVVYKHTGYISTEDLSSKIQDLLLNKPTQ